METQTCSHSDRIVQHHGSLSRWLSRHRTSMPWAATTSGVVPSQPLMTLGQGNRRGPRGRTSKKDLECVESCKRDEKKLRLLSRWGSLGAKIGLWKKQVHIGILTKILVVSHGYQQTWGSAESHGFGWQQLCYSSVTIGIFREQLCIVSGLQFSFQPTDSWEKMAIDSIRQAQILPMEVEDPLKCENDGGYAG